MAHPAVKDCAVIGVPDDKGRGCQRLLISLCQSVSPQALIQFRQGPLGSVKAPKEVEIVRAAATQRWAAVLKKEVRKKYWHAERMAS